MVDRIFGWLMLICSVLQAVQAWRQLHMPNALPAFFACGTAFAAIFLATVNLVRAERRHDLVLARVCVFGNLVWLILILSAIWILFPPLEPLLSVQAAIAFALLLLSMRSRKRSRPM
jgi:hypothetical protein